MNKYLITIQPHHKMNFFTFLVVAENEEYAKVDFMKSYNDKGYVLVSCKPYKEKNNETF